MARIAYIEKRFSAASLDVITTADTICAEYAAQGFDLTLRQLYYQFVARGYLANRQTEYKRLGGIISDARLAGLLDWNYIVDRTRNLRDLAHWSTPESIVSASASQYRTDRWADQAKRAEVWIEKDALVGVIAGTCNGLDVPYFSCRGYTSQSELWGAAARLKRYERAGQDCTIIHLGDHDPSGLDMTRDIRDRLRMFGCGATVNRVALTWDQVQQYQPPPNPAKMTDARAADYVEQYGGESWELDALDPPTMAALITAEVTALRDDDVWDASTEAMNRQKWLLEQIAGRWDEVTEFVETT